MNRPLVVALLAALASSSAVAAEYLEMVESPVFEAPGAASEIVKRAQLCASRILRNDEVRIADSAAGGGFIPIPGAGKTGGVTGGNVLVSVDPEQGIMVANSRIDYRAMLTARNARSTLTLLAKDGRFKIQHTNIETLQKSTGYVENDGYTRQGKWKGAGWEKAQDALQSVSVRLAECIKQPAAGSDW